MTHHPLTALPAFRHQNLLIEFASLKHAAPRGIYLSLTPNNATVWHGVMFIRRGLYRGAILRFTLTFPFAYPSTPLDIILVTRVFHPLVSPKHGKFSIPGHPAPQDVLEALERFKSAFEDEGELERVREGDVVDREAWRAWNGRRETKGGWCERVEKCVRRSVEAVEEKAEEDVIRFGEILEREEVEALVEEARRNLRERGVEVREC
ncbi:hypothetical protein EX30DRAFT_343487 [Ascodesmis nigricans]|uniref:UBC core domain-containing protein n=1 Tax=Ascodesmis nigricans TaxID=341454 RepID=A0A4S2MRV4_9PEZI|nr:hypothetical protein EX30DRAFT_343487 [Ascodesmis nigricans]